MELKDDTSRLKEGMAAGQKPVAERIQVEFLVNAWRKGLTAWGLAGK